MKPSETIEVLRFAIRNRFNVLLTSKPGSGKTDITGQATQLENADLITSHPAVSDPTDYKGFPFKSIDANGKDFADFLPFGQLRRLIEATTPTVFFLDDLGQAPPTVQAAIMQLLLSRRVNEHRISDFVTFIAATNRKEDKAGVTGILEPVKNRFHAILELDIDIDDWTTWAINNNMPTELIAFMRLRGMQIVDSYTPSKDIVNGPTLRSIAAMGKMQAAGIPKGLQFEMFKGAVGQAAALEYNGFLDMLKHMPNLDAIILNPTGSAIPTDPGILYALTGGLAAKMNETNMPAIITYLNRLNPEMEVCCMKDAVTRKNHLANTLSFNKWIVSPVGKLLNA